MNYFDITRSYNELKIAKRVRAKANSLFYALIGKANTLRFPAKLTVFNSELMDLSGLSKDELHPARNTLTQVTINNQFLIKYHKKGTRKPGLYEINYEGFEHFFQNETTYWSDNYSENPTNENDYSDNSTNSNTNYDTNYDTNTGENHLTLVGKSDTLLTNLTERNDSSTTFGDVSSFYQQNFGVLSQYIGQDLEAWCNDLSPELVLEAMKRTLDEKKQWRYSKGILKNWHENNLKTLKDVEVSEKAFRRKKNKDELPYHEKYKSNSVSSADMFNMGVDEFEWGDKRN